MNGKVVLITGATDGIGKVTARALAQMGATVVGVGRNAEKGARVADEIRTLTRNPNVSFLTADLSSQAEVRRLARAFLGEHDRLHVLVNNAGAVFATRQATVDGLEMTLALNHFSYFLLTHLLLDLLKASAPARIVNVSSGAHMGGSFNFADPQFRKGYTAWGAYSQSKLANVLFTYELARRLEGTGVTANVLHPGFVATQFGRNNGGLMRWVMPLVQSLAKTPEQGAATSLYLASSPEVEGVTGQYFVDQRATRSSPASYDVNAARRLWEISEQMVGLPTRTPQPVAG